MRLRDFTALTMPRVGRVEETGDPSPPYRLLDTAAVPPKLQGLHDALAGTQRTATSMSWLSKEVVSTGLSNLASGRRPLIHEALDELPDSKAVEHVRSVLVAVKWQRAAAGDWGAYAAEVSRRSAPLTSPFAHDTEQGSR
ncbi:hypothetical protein [Streptomyces sp. NPDC049881]|uniref:hypothetical protein n=1 Tax=Streptomyces sp. NPDC049881 TaxID=3155778 RepID=UPI003417B337